MKKQNHKRQEKIRKRAERHRQKTLRSQRGTGPTPQKKHDHRISAHSTGQGGGLDTEMMFVDEPLGGMP